MDDVVSYKWVWFNVTELMSVISLLNVYWKILKKKLLHIKNNPGKSVLLGVVILFVIIYNSDLTGKEQSSGLLSKFKDMDFTSPRMSFSFKKKS